MKKFVYFYLPVVIALLALALTAYAGDPTPQPNLTLEVSADEAKLTGMALEVGTLVVIDGTYKADVISAESDTAVLHGGFSEVQDGEYAVVAFGNGVVWIEWVGSPPVPPEPPEPRCPPAC